jgi:hypothetical protein
MRPDRLVPTLVLLGVLAALLVGSLFTHLPGVPSVATALLGLGWPGWDRAADMATVVGLPLGIIALTIAAWEQIRISRELRRRPKPVVGFFPDMSERALDAIRIGRYPEPRPTKLALGIGVENRGERTARNVTLKVRGPSRSAQPGRRSEWSVTASKD